MLVSYSPSISVHSSITSTKSYKLCYDSVVRYQTSTRLVMLGSAHETVGPVMENIFEMHFICHCSVFVFLLVFYIYITIYIFCYRLEI